ncbi:hypothetical protein M231_00069 [Tremella mesenterica]|uniref:Uncharacterized protein n=1 Tax=Tremella mesenterica TaxID=5217 RepID=A0A4Q1BWG6_TREME|nr:hypothetical protein M231_00069 [Tremella mesenterica]
MEVQELRTLIKPPKRHKAGATVGNIGVHNFTGGTVLERLQEIEEAAKKKKEKGKERKKGTEKVTGSEAAKRGVIEGGTGGDVFISTTGESSGVMEVSELSEGSTAVRRIILHV